QTLLGVRTCRVDLSDRNGRCRDEPFDFAHGSAEALALGGTERGEERFGKRVTALIEHGALEQPGGCQPRSANPAVIGAGPEGDQPGLDECAEEAAEIPGVES